MKVTVATGTGLALVSVTRTTSGLMNASPTVADSADPETTLTMAGAPAVMVTLLLVAEAIDPSVAVSVYVPVLSILHPVKLATPDVAFRGFAAQARAAPAGLVKVRVTDWCRW